MGRYWFFQKELSIVSKRFKIISLPRVSFSHMPSLQSIKIFIAYARKDHSFLEELKKQFVPLVKAELIQVWYDGVIKPGENWDHSIKKELSEADIILLLVSPDSIASEYFYTNEMLEAIERHETGNVSVIPVILRPCQWEITPLAKLQALPKDGTPINLWQPMDAGYFDVVNRIKAIVDDIASIRLTKGIASSDEKTFGTIQFRDSEGTFIIYQGEIFRGRANGYGTGKTLNRREYYEYTGNYFNNLRHDQKATIVWSDGSRYIGAFTNDHITGEGFFQWSSGDTYKGNFFKGKKEGYGEFKRDPKNKYLIEYKGFYMNDSYHGDGWLKEVVDEYLGARDLIYEYQGTFWEGKK
jgi:hypothetical protein